MQVDLCSIHRNQNCFMLQMKLPRKTNTQKYIEIRSEKVDSDWSALTILWFKFTSWEIVHYLYWISLNQSKIKGRRIPKMMPILLLIVVHLTMIQNSNAQFDCPDDDCTFNDPTAIVEHIVKPRESSAQITFPTEPWRGCGLRNVGGIGTGSTSTSTSASVCTHPFHFIPFQCKMNTQSISHFSCKSR